MSNLRLEKKENTKRRGLHAVSQGRCCELGVHGRFTGRCMCETGPPMVISGSAMSETQLRVRDMVGSDRGVVEVGT